MSTPPVLPEITLSLTVPAEGLHAEGVTLRFPRPGDIDGILPAFTDEELREAGNLPAFNRDELAASIEELPELAERGRLLALAAADAETGEIIGGATLHHLDSERRIVEIGYFASLLRAGAVLPRRSRECSPSTPSRSASSVSRRT
jgi:RimJ/RimL family protein N-acetyltransferase